MESTRQPKQRRSHATLAKLLDAARGLLEEKTFDEVSIQDIVNRAGSSVGAFYARFSDKNALLDALRDAFRQDTADEARRLSESKDWTSMPLATVVAEYVGVLVREHRRHRGTLRALVGRSISGKRPVEADRGLESTSPWLSLMRSRRSEISHPDPDVAVHLGFGMAVSAVRERVLFPELGASARPAASVTDAVFAGELTRALVRFLGVNEPRRSG